MLGTYSVTAGKNNSLFTVLEVQRDHQQESSKITSVKIISQIYERPSPAKGEERYVYVYSDGTLSSGTSTNGYTLRYDRAKMKTLSEANALYYFEIPLNAGDYAIGATSNDNATAYLLYLDIGANGDKVVGDDDVDAPGETAEHQIAGVTFVDSDAIAAKSTEGYSIVTFKVVISESGYGKSHGGLLLMFNRSSKTNITVTETDTGGVFGVTELTDDKSLTVGIGPPSG